MPARPGVFLQPARFQITPRGIARAPAQLVLEELAGGGNDFVQRLAPLFARFVFRRPCGQFDARVLRQPLHRFGEGEALHLTQPFESVAARAAAEAMIGAPLVLDLEARGLFLVERTAAPEHAPLAGELDAFSYQLDEVRPA